MLSNCSWHLLNNSMLLSGKRDLGPGECSVQFLKEPMFNTALIIGYYWIPLIILVSLYAQIFHKVIMHFPLNKTNSGLSYITMFLRTLIFILNWRHGLWAKSHQKRRKNGVSFYQLLQKSPPSQVKPCQEKQKR